MVFLLSAKLASWSVLVVAVLAVFLAIGVPSDEAFRQSDLAELSKNLTVIVTGANSGLGYGTVAHLARAGTAKTVLLACRNAAKCQAARDDAQDLLPQKSTTRLVAVDLDLADRSSIEAFVENLPTVLGSEKGEEVIDVLINNAGIFASSAELSFINDVEEHMLVNHLAPFLLTHLLWPALERSKARIVSISSISALVPTDPLAGWHPSEQQWSEASSLTSGFFRYLRTKRANLVFAREIHRRFNETGISSVASHPGYTRSHIWSNGAKCFPSILAKLIQSNKFFSMSSSEGALTQLWAALDRGSVASGSYVGPRWWLYGNPIHLGPIETPSFPYHHATLSKEDELWERSMNELSIQTFGRP